MTTDEKLDLLLNKMGHIEDYMVQIDDRMVRMEDRMVQMEDRMVQMKDNIQNVKLTLENVTNRNIQLIAEGHFELIRKLDEATKACASTEMTRIRVNVMDDDLRQIKRAIGM